MNEIEELRQAAIAKAVKVNLTSTFDFIKRMHRWRKGTIQSLYPTLNDLEIEIKKSNRAYRFKTPPLLSCESPVQYQHDGYGLKKPFRIICGEDNYLVKYAPGSVTIKMGLGFSTEGELWELESKFEEGNGYFRAVFPVDGFVGLPLTYLLGQSFAVGDALRAAGLVNIQLRDFQLEFFDYAFEKQRYVFIDCKTETDFAKFEKLVEAVVYSFGFISGSLIRDEITILKFGDSRFEQITGFQFRRVEDSIVSSLELINPREHMEWGKLHKRVYFPERTFSNLIQLCMDDSAFLRAIRIVTQARQLPNEIQIASFYVALETVKGIVLGKNIARTKSFKSPEYAKGVIAKLRQIIEELPAEEFLNKNRVLGKIDYLNDIGNNEGFFSAFEYVGFALSDTDKKFIQKRNLYLHGSFDFENDSEEIRSQELEKIALNVQRLTCCLILKYAGYSGPIKDSLKYLDLVRGKGNLNEALFQYI